MNLSILIADDEPHARRYLSDLLSKEEGIDKIVQCNNGKEVLQYLNHHQPHIIFLDINMPGISGIEVAAKLKGSQSLIVFSTAYDEYALKAFELQAFDYLLKPFDLKRFKEVINRAKSELLKMHKATFSERIFDMYTDFSKPLTPYLEHIELKEKGSIKTISIKDVLYIEANSVYAVLYLTEKKHLYRASLNILEQQLPPNFIRIHRSYIINKNFVDKTIYLNNSTYSFTLKNGDVIISSRSYKDRISKTIE